MIRSIQRPSAHVVAKLAGVSQSAVSRAFTEGASIAPATREKVLAAARKVGYRPNVIARSLITRETNIIGIVVADLINPLYTEFLSALSAQLQERNRYILLFTVPPKQTVDDIIPMVLQYQVSTVIIAAATISSTMAQECLNRGTPVIQFYRRVPNTPAHVIAVDNYQGGVMAAQALIDAGHKRFGYISGHKNTSTNLERKAGFFDTLKTHGISNVVSYEEQYSYEGGRLAGLQILSGRPRPDAIFCATDILACGLIDAARELGVAIPADLSVIGFDDIAQAGWEGYSLTTLRPPTDLMVKAVADLAVSLGESGASGKLVHQLMPPYLVTRRSSRPGGGEA
jgi:DNA-binding LacI/PurR family transcriptional regulator